MSYDDIAESVDVRPYRVVARLKNNRLWQAIRDEFPDATTQSAAARCLRVAPTQIGNLLNLTYWPYGQRRQAWHAIAEKIATALRSTPEYLFDGDLYGHPARRVEVELAAPDALALGLVVEPVSPIAAHEQRMLTERCEEVLATLRPQEAMVMRRRFGLDGEPEATVDEIRKDVKVTASRIHQIEMNALRKLRHPTRARVLREYV